MIPSSYEQTAALVLGLLLAFAGYRIYRLSLNVAGFLMGFIVGVTLGSALAHGLGLGQWEMALTTGLGLILGMGGSFLVHKAVKLVLLTSGFFLGLTARHLVLTGGPQFPPSPPAGGLSAFFQGLDLSALLVAVIGALVAVLLERWFVILLTALWGAMLAGAVLGHPAYFYGFLVAGLVSQAVRWPPGSRRKEEGP